MKDDVPVPDVIPRKRRQLEDESFVLDRFIAVWLTREDLTPSERRRLDAERERRRAAGPDVLVGLVVAEEGTTPPQFMRVLEQLRALRATKVVHTYLPRKHHGTLVGACHELGVERELVIDVRGIEQAARTVITGVDAVILAPREATVQTHATPGVWSAVGLARHRGVPTTVVLPSGETQDEQGRS